MISLHPDVVVILAGANDVAGNGGAITPEVGLYSVVSYTVAQRTNEFGIRMALGAMPGNVLGLVFRSTAVSVGTGIAVGLGLTLVLAQWATGSAGGGWALGVATLVLGLRLWWQVGFRRGRRRGSSRWRLCGTSELGSV